MAPLPLIPLANTLPAIGVILLCLGMAERDGALLLFGHLVALLSVLYVGALFYFAAEAGSNPQAALDMVLKLFGQNVRRMNPQGGPMELNAPARHAGQSHAVGSGAESRAGPA